MWKKTCLDNGVRIVTEEVPYANSAVIGIWVKTGSRNEQENNHGVSHFIEHLLFKGTTNRTAKQIAEELEAVGGTLNAFTTKEYTCYYAKVLSENMPQAIELLSDMFFNSTFNHEDIEKEKNVVLEEIKMYEDTPDEIIHDLFAQTVWQNHPLGRTILGSSESINSMERSKIIDYFTKHYIPGNTVISVAGNITHQQVVEQLSKYFLDWDTQSQIDYTCTQKPVPQANVRFTEKDTEQVQICLGAPGLPQEHSFTYVLLVLNNILGGGLSSRLFQSIREERGLAYSIYSYHTSYVDSGLFTVYAGTSPNKFQEVVELIVKEIAKLKKEGITEEELTKTKKQIRGGLLLSMESVSNRMSRLGRTELCHGRVITAEEVVEKISQVSVDEVMDLCNLLFKTEKFSLTAIGPIQGKFDFYQLLKDTGI